MDHLLPQQSEEQFLFPGASANKSGFVEAAETPNAGVLPFRSGDLTTVDFSPGVVVLILHNFMFAYFEYSPFSDLGSR